MQQETASHRDYVAWDASGFTRQTCSNGPRPLRASMGSIVLAFFFLDRSSELCGATTGRNSGNGSTHCVKGEDMTLCNQHGEAIVPGTGSANSVEIFFRSHKGNQRRQMTTLRHYRSGQQALRPVAAVETC
ncbi:hypothetical protein GQ600_20730 [Phytophthora cactorum]|nr:hypothetical protein GQ600_20730 [Phytophthora cactorum]